MFTYGQNVYIIKILGRPADSTKFHVSFWWKIELFLLRKILTEYKI